MLMLRRSVGEEVIINNGQIRVKLISVINDSDVLLGFDAAKDIPIHREEVQQRVLLSSSQYVLHRLLK